MWSDNLICNLREHGMLIITIFFPTGNAYSFGIYCGKLMFCSLFSVVYLHCSVIISNIYLGRTALFAHFVFLKGDLAFLCFQDPAVSPMYMYSSSSSCFTVDWYITFSFKPLRFQIIVICGSFIILVKTQLDTITLYLSHFRLLFGGCYSNKNY